MPATNATLPDQWWPEEGEPVQLWITSIPPYYCQNNGAPGNDFSADSVWAGVSTGGYGTPTSKTTGLKYAVQYGDTGGSDPKMDDGIGNAVTWMSIDNPGTPYYQAGTADGDWALQTSYDVSINRYDLPFGPYKLNLTTDGTPYPAADGDIIIVTTGSTVLAGALGDGAAQYSAQDTRAFNLIFYSTGSANVNDLVQSIPENAAPGSTTALTSYNGVTRHNFIVNSGGLFAFVAIPNQGGGNLMWWPITWDASLPTSTPFIRSWNAS